MKINKHLNRYETFNSHQYIQELGDDEWKKEIKYDGFIKCKLMHGQVGSVIVPDLLFYQLEDDKSFSWIQPLAFRANRIYYEETDATAVIMIDISARTTVSVRFKRSNLIQRFSDSSELYKCEILASEDLSQHYTGKGVFKDNFLPFIKLYHHTTHDASGKIKGSGFLLNSKWNIGGTKELSNIGYVYFTPLDKLKYDDDLIQVAMSSNGSIHLTTNTGEIRKVNIYRRNVNHFETTLDFLVDTQNIAPSHLYKRRDSMGGVFYLICSPFIHRVGMNPTETLKFEKNIIEDNSKKADYIIVGDCDRLDGVTAPYDEENTSYIFKIEDRYDSKNLFDFWEEFSNTDQYTEKEVKYQKFVENE